MRAVVLRSPREMSLTERPEPPPPGEGEALVRVLRVGVCGTDLHAFHGDQPMVSYPRVLGHELAVEVLTVGPRVAGLEPGDVCAVVPYVDCGTCLACRAGRPNACLNLRVLGVHVDGGMSDLLSVPARLLLRAGDLPVDAVAMVEMLAVGEHAAARASLAHDDRVLVVGAGPIGLAATAAARRRTPQVAVHDLDADRLAFVAAQRLARTVTAGAAGELRDAAAAALYGTPPNVVIDATGSTASMVAAASLLTPGGRLVLVGHTGGTLAFDNQTLHRLELTVLASRNATTIDFAAVLGDLRAGTLDVEPWVTHRARLEDVPGAFAAWTARPPGLVKALVEVG